MAHGLLLSVNAMCILTENSILALHFKSNLLVKTVVFLLNAVFAMAILNLISLAHLASFVIMQSKQIKFSTFSGFF